MTMYKRIEDEQFTMTKNDVIDFVWEFPFFTDPGTVGIIDSNGVKYTGKDLYVMAGIKWVTKQEYEENKDIE